MARKAMKESEKAATPLSDHVFAAIGFVESIKAVALSIEKEVIPADERMRETGRTELCALRDTCNVLILQGAEADLEEGSAQLQRLRAEVAAKLEGGRRK